MAGSFGDDEDDSAFGVGMEALFVEAVARYLEAVETLAALEAGFLVAAAAYANVMGITRAAWLEFGVAPAVLDCAGIVEEGGGERLAPVIPLHPTQ